MRRTGLLLFYLTLISLGPNQAFSQAPAVSTETDKQKVLVGELVTLKIRVNSGKSDAINWSLTDSALTEFNILKSTVTQNEPRITVREIILTSADSGTIETDRLPVEVTSNGKKRTLMASVVTVTFLPEKTIAALHDLKPQQNMAYTFYRHPLFWAPAIFFLLAAAGLGFWHRKIIKGQAIAESSSGQTALQQLHKLGSDLNRQNLPNAEVSRRLAAILKESLEPEQVPGNASDSETVGKIAQKLEWLQFGPEARKSYQEKKLINELLRLLTEQEIKTGSR